MVCDLLEKRECEKEEEAPGKGGAGTTSSSGTCCSQLTRDVSRLWIDSLNIQPGFVWTTFSFSRRSEKWKHHVQYGELEIDVQKRDPAAV